MSPYVNRSEERFTERARQVVTIAQEEARTLRHGYIGTEHLLLGLLGEEEGMAARALERCDMTAERVRAQVVHIVGRGEEVTPHQLPFTSRAKKVLELALREALSLGHNHIGAQHILLSLVRENEGVAARILHDFGADPQKVRDTVISMLSGLSGLSGLPGLPARPRTPSQGERTEANPFCALTAEQRQLLACALAGNYPAHLEQHRATVIGLLASADRAAA